MRVRPGQNVMFKTDNPPFNLPPDAKMVVTMVTESTGMVCVNVEGGGAHWLKEDELENAEGDDGDTAEPHRAG